ncbi:MAG: GNAT family N-acetyltransferase, partial [Fuerstiella sp.]
MLRNYRAEDQDELMATWAAASKIAHPFLSDEFQQKVGHDIANVYLPVTENWVWEADGRVVGFVSLYRNEIGGLFVDPSFQRQGIGKALVDYVGNEREQLEVEVFKDNVIGRAFYAKYGFVLKEESVHEETGFDLLRLSFCRGSTEATAPWRNSKRAWCSEPRRVRACTHHVARPSSFSNGSPCCLQQGLRSNKRARSGASIAVRPFACA